MGRRLGADFSKVRFHTGKDAEARADAVDARAYTSGADVYFGEGGFDPAVAAHELVHTAQQGMVDSSVATVSTPAGGVQRASIFDKRKRRHKDELEMVYRIYTGTAVGMTPEQQQQWLQNHADAVKEFQKPKVAKDAERWAKKRDQQVSAAKEFLSTDMADFLKNRSSFISDEQADSIQPDDTEIVDMDEDDTEIVDMDDDSPEAEEIAAGPQEEDLEGSPGAQEAPGRAASQQAEADEAVEAAEAETEQEALPYPTVRPLGLGQAPGRGQRALRHGDRAATGVDYGSMAPDMVSSLQEGKYIPTTGAPELNMGLGAAKALTGAYGSAKSGVALVKALKEKDKGAAAKAGVELVSNLASTAGGGATMAKALGSAAAKSIAPGVDVFTGSVEALRGARQTYKGHKQVKGMNDFMEQTYGVNLNSSKKDKAIRAEERNKLTDLNDRVMWDTAVQAKMEGRREEIKGSGKMVTGALDAAGGILDLTGAAAAAGVAVKAASAAGKVGFSLANRAQKKRVKKKVIAQTTGLTKEVILQFAKRYGFKNFNRAKQALLKAMGYQSGRRSELVADQIAKRAHLIVTQALNLTSEAGDKARAFMQGMGIEVDRNNPEKAKQELAQRLGQVKNRSDFAPR